MKTHLVALPFFKPLIILTTYCGNYFKPFFTSSIHFTEVPVNLAICSFVSDGSFSISLIT